MLCLDLIITISEYLEDSNYYLLNKSFYKIINMIERGPYWREKYNNFFENLNKEYLILNGDYNWKREYMRIMKFDHWSEIILSDTLELYDRNMTEIPKEIGNLTNLVNLNLSNNKIKVIPKEIGNLTNLVNLTLLRNEIKEIPKEFFVLNKLCRLDFGENQIKKVPEEISNLIGLKFLDFSYNKIYRIPNKIYCLVNLEYLDFSYNKIKNVPKTFCKLIKPDKIQYIDISENQIRKNKIRINNRNIPILF